MRFKSNYHYLIFVHVGKLYKCKAIPSLHFAAPLSDLEETFLHLCIVMFSLQIIWCTLRLKCVCVTFHTNRKMVPLSIGSIKKAMWQVGNFSALVTVTEKGEPSVQLHDTNLPRRLLGEKNTYAVACWHSAHLATWWLWVLKIRVEEVISTVTSWTDFKV